MRVRSLNRTSEVILCMLAVAIATVTAAGQQRTGSVEGEQPAAKVSPSTAELRAIIENQPDFIADAFVSYPEDLQNTNVGRIARKGELYRFDPSSAAFPRGDESEFKLVRPGSHLVTRLEVEASALSLYALVVRPRERNYVEVSIKIDPKSEPSDEDGDDFFEIWSLLVAHPHALMLLAARETREKVEFQHSGEMVIDGHPCVKFEMIPDSGSGTTTFYAARDLNNLVIRIDWMTAGSDSIVQFFPVAGTTTLRNVKLGPTSELFGPPTKFTKVDRLKPTKEKHAGDRSGLQRSGRHLSRLARKQAHSGEPREATGGSRL